MKYLLVIFIYFSVAINYAQEVDSISLQKIKDEQVLAIERWEAQLKSARERQDLYTEMLILPRLIQSKIADFGDNTSAYENIIHLKKLIEDNPNSRALKFIEADFNMLMGMLLRDQFKLDESLDHFKKATVFSKRDGNFEIYRDASNHVGEILSMQGKNEEAIIYFNKLEKTGVPSEFEDADEMVYLTRVYQFKAEHFLRNDELDSTLYYARKSLYDGASTNMMSNRYGLMATAFLDLNKEMDSTIYFANKSLSLALDIGAEREEIYGHDLLRQVYQKKGDFKLAYFHFDKFYELQQRQRSYDNALKIGSLNIAQEQERAQFQQALANERLSNQRIIIWIVTCGLLLLIIGLYYIFNRLKLIRKQNKIIEQEKLRAEQSERYKEQFLANMSHEIRTPMNAISGMINAITRRNHPKYQDVYLDAMKISLDNLLVIINDVLDLSKIESGNLEISQVNMSFHDVIEHVKSILKYKAEEKGIVLKSSIQDNFPKVIIGDPVRLNQILMNLVGNAIKFTDSGFVEINLSYENDEIKVSISDSGIGISQDQLKTIFDSFKQGSNISKSNYGGTGLGLSITKQLIELQNGKIWAESVLGKGSTFFFELPLMISQDSNDVQSAFSDSQLVELGKELKGLHVLIAEDNEFNIMVVKDDLNWYIPEIDIKVVENGKLAVEAFSNNEYDLILMDVQMPELNGYEATKAIRKLEKETKTPIIAMTASLLKNQIDKCYKAGMDAYIPKPYKPEELIRTLHDVIQNNQ